MSRIVENEEGFPAIDFRKVQAIKFGAHTSTTDYSGRVRDTLKFRKILFQLWVETEDFNTKGLIEDAIEEINKRLIKDLDIF